MSSLAWILVAWIACNLLFLAYLALGSFLARRRRLARAARNAERIAAANSRPLTSAVERKVA